MEQSVPEVDKIYRHFKGGYYLVLEIARHIETNEEFVIYRRFFDDGIVWARPMSHWVAPVVLDSGKEIPRFVEVDPVAEFGNYEK